MNKLSIKMLVMTVITSAATLIADTGWPVGIGWAVLGISVLGTLLVYVAQSVYLPTQSDLNDANWTDIIKGGVVSVGNFLSLYAASYLPGAHIDWQDILKSAGMVFIMYIIKQFRTAPTQFKP